MWFNNAQPNTTILTVKDQAVAIIDSTKLLGTILTNDLKWDLNVDNIVKKANARIELLRKVVVYGASKADLSIIYILYIRSLLEQSATV